MKALYMLSFINLAVYKLIYSGHCLSDNIHIGYNFTLPIPVEYIQGFNGKAYLMETDQMPLNFRTALSVDAVDGIYCCSLQVFLGNVKVWTSGHHSMFCTTSQSCVLEFTEIGDLRLKAFNGQIGWRTATFGQGVQKLQLFDSGNLALVDAQENIKWQSFNFPTNVLLMGQRLSVATHLTSSIPTNNSNSFFSFEIHHDKLALYLNLGSNDIKYSYWEFHPSATRNITYIHLSSKGLDLFDDKYRNFSQILSPIEQPVRFLALANDTGNLGLYYYSPYKDKFEASFQVLNATCDLPLACSPYEICTYSNTCSCIRLLTNPGDHTSKFDCDPGITGKLCGKKQVEMIELQDSGTLLRNSTTMTNVSKDECANSCLNDCDCAAALYSSRIGECMFYDTVRGVKQVNRGSGLSYLVKVPKGSTGNQKKSGLRKWVLVLIIAADGLILCVVIGGLGYFLIWKRRKMSNDCNSDAS
ncbi:G-type lectin S-receptor-like serine/threonine-protein kinase SD2-5 [Silene latifolia]|uniref:G-type lectin S-receptor-like serine/threonine-protein kinase SD2-5 n=1 Tax=Silene latifolia TaxID=37657 RepID=UPI003D788F51